MARRNLWFKSRLEMKLFSIIIIIIAGFGALILLTINKETEDLIKKTREKASFLTTSVVTSLQKDMMEGRADMARWLIEDLKTMKSVKRLQIVRTDGTEAFQDLITIRDVEKRTAIKKEWLENHPDKATNPIAKGIDEPFFILQEAQSNWLAFKDTRDNELIPAIYSGRLGRAKELALGIQKERYNKFIALTEQLVEIKRKEAEENIETSQSQDNRISVLTVSSLHSKLNNVRAALLTMMSETERARQEAQHDIIKKLTSEIDESFNVLVENSGFKGEPILKEIIRKATTEMVEYNEKIEGREIYTFLKPIPNEPRCFGCHGSDKNLRGILMVSIAVDKDIQSIRWYLIITSAITVLIVIASLRTLTNKIILNPITHLVDVVNKISMGEVDKKIEITSNDEIQDLADAIGRLRTSMKMAIEKLYKR